MLRPPMRRIRRQIYSVLDYEALLDWIKSADRVNQSCLSGSICADDSYRFSLADMHRHAVENYQISVPCGQFLDCQHRYAPR